MTKAEIREQALSLPVDDQLDLAQKLWDNASPPDDFTVTAELRELLDERLETARRDPKNRSSIEETDRAVREAVAEAR